MAYAKQTWTDSPSTSSPLSAARLNYIESGIDAAHVLAGSGADGALVFDVMKYPFNAAGDGVTNDAAAIQAAIDAAEGVRNGVVRLGRQHALGTGLTIQARGVTIEGYGPRATALYPTHTGWTLTITDAGRSGEWQAADTTWTRNSDNSGVALRGFMINGVNRANLRNGIRIFRADDLVMEDVTFGYLSGTALQIGGDGVFTGDFDNVRESEFTRVKIYKCGNTANAPGVYPAMVITAPESGTGDGTNQLYFHNFRFVYNHAGIRIHNNHPSELIRRIMFTDCQFHGLSHSSLSDPGNEDAQADNNHDLVTIEGKVTTILFQNAFCNGVGAGYSLFRLKPKTNPAASNPDNIILKGLIVAENPGSLLEVDAAQEFHLQARTQSSAASDANAYLVNAPNTSGVDNYSIVLDGRDPQDIAAKVNIGTGHRHKGSVTVNGNNRDEVRRLIYSGGAWPTRGWDSDQTHLWIGPNTPPASFVAGVDVWIDTTP